jgi:ubiquinone/menaquinone biosynthesis C-methylase UbiE
MRAGTLLRYHALRPVLIAEIGRGARIFDVGGHDGFISHRLMKLIPGLDITVIDTDNSALQTAKEQDLQAVQASALHLPIEDNYLDVILCLDLIEHLEEEQLLMQEISRALKDGGKLILTTPSQNGVSFPCLSKAKNAKIARDWGHVRDGYSLEQIRRLLSLYNLIMIKNSKYFNWLSRFAYLLKTLSGRRLMGKNILYNFSIKLEPYTKFRAQEHIIIAKKRVR